MGVKLTVKILAEGLIFEPSAWLRSMSGMLDVLIFSVNMVWMAWMLLQVQPFSLAKMFMILHCFGCSVYSYWCCTCAKLWPSCAKASRRSS